MTPHACVFADSGKEQQFEGSVALPGGGEDKAGRERTEEASDDGTQEEGPIPERAKSQFVAAAAKKKAPHATAGEEQVPAPDTMKEWQLKDQVRALVGQVAGIQTHEVDQNIVKECWIAPSSHAPSRSLGKN